MPQFGLEFPDLSFDPLRDLPTLSKLSPPHSFDGSPCFNKEYIEELMDWILQCDPNYLVRLYVYLCCQEGNSTEEYNTPFRYFNKSTNSYVDIDSDQKKIYKILYEKNKSKLTDASTSSDLTNSSIEFFNLYYNDLMPYIYSLLATPYNATVGFGSIGGVGGSIIDKVPIYQEIEAVSAGDVPSYIIQQYKNVGGADIHPFDPIYIVDKIIVNTVLGRSEYQIAKADATSNRATALWLPIAVVSSDISYTSAVLASGATMSTISTAPFGNISARNSIFIVNFENRTDKYASSLPTSIKIPSGNGYINYTLFNTLKNFGQNKFVYLAEGGGFTITPPSPPSIVQCLGRIGEISKIETDDTAPNLETSEALRFTYYAAPSENVFSIIYSGRKFQKDCLPSDLALELLRPTFPWAVKGKGGKLIFIDMGLAVFYGETNDKTILNQVQIIDANGLEFEFDDFSEKGKNSHQDPCRFYTFAKFTGEVVITDVDFQVVGAFTLPEALLEIGGSTNVTGNWITNYIDSSGQYKVYSAATGISTTTIPTYGINDQKPHIIIHAPLSDGNHLNHFSIQKNYLKYMNPKESINFTQNTNPYDVDAQPFNTHITDDTGVITQTIGPYPGECPYKMYFSTLNTGSTSLSPTYVLDTTGDFYACRHFLFKAGGFNSIRLNPYPNDYGNVNYSVKSLIDNFPLSKRYPNLREVRFTVGASAGSATSKTIPLDANVDVLTHYSALRTEGTYFTGFEITLVDSSTLTGITSFYSENKMILPLFCYDYKKITTVSSENFDTERALADGALQSGDQDGDTGKESDNVTYLVQDGVRKRTQYVLNMKPVRNAPYKRGINIHNNDFITKAFYKLYEKCIESPSVNVVNDPLINLHFLSHDMFGYPEICIIGDAFASQTAYNSFLATTAIGRASNDKTKGNAIAYNFKLTSNGVSPVEWEALNAPFETIIAPDETTEKILTIQIPNNHEPFTIICKDSFNKEVSNTKSKINDIVGSTIESCNDDFYVVESGVRRHFAPRTLKYRVKIWPKTLPKTSLFGTFVPLGFLQSLKLNTATSSNTSIVQVGTYGGSLDYKSHYIYGLAVGNATLTIGKVIMGSTVTKAITVEVWDVVKVGTSTFPTTMAITQDSDGNTVPINFEISGNSSYNHKWFITDTSVATVAIDSTDTRKASITPLKAGTFKLIVCDSSDIPWRSAEVTVS